MSSSSRIFVLKSADGELFETEEAVVKHMPILKRLIENNNVRPCIIIPIITGDILSKVIAYCQKHVNTAGDDDALKSFDDEFINVDEMVLIGLETAARYLEIKNLSDLLSEALAERRRKRRFGR